MTRKRTLMLGAAIALCALSSSAQGREVRNLNFGWTFNSTQTVDLPHDFQISQPWVAPGKDERADNSDMAANVKSRLSARGFKEMGTGTYQKTLTPDEAWKGKRVLLDFEGIMLVGDVWLNGKHVGKTDYGYLGFDIDISKELKWGQPNTIVVKADTRKENNSRWYTGGGLYRDVNVIVTDPQQFFTRHPLQITTPEVSAASATVIVSAELACYLRVNKLKVGTRITDRRGRVVYDQTKTIPFNRGQKVNEHRIDSITISNPDLWSTDHPSLYHAEVTLYRPDGTVADRVTERFGVRKVEFSPAFGLKVNGEKVILKGIANHHTLGALGAAAYPRAIEKRLRLLKDFGFNHVRTSHNPYSVQFLDLCDSLGILVVDELYDKWLTQYAGGREEWVNMWQHDVPEWVRRDRNHPSVVMWSLGNELQTYWSLPYADWGVTPYRLQHTLLKRYDTTRPVTVAMHPRGRNQQTDSLPAPLVLETDIASYNYRYMYFPGDSRRFPNLIFYQSEANTSMMGPNYFEMDLGRVVGLAYWGMIDYLGESTGWPSKGWPNGVFDISLEPKPMAWLLRSMFKPEEPTVHIGIVDSDDNTVWNNVKVGTKRMSDHWNRTPGSQLTLYTYTNADEVELLVNGKSLGTRRNERENPKARNKIRWDKVAYEPGYIEAVARKDGKVVARHRVETTGATAALKAEADKAQWAADGTDLMHVRVAAVDKRGRQVPQEDRELTFTVDGPARIVGVINGDITSDELTTGNCRKLYNGTATVILRSTREAGKVRLSVTAPGLKRKELKLETGRQAGQAAI